MKKNKITLLIMSIALIVTMIGCSPTNKNMRNLSTQTRLKDENVNNRFMNNNTPINKREGVNDLNTGLRGNNNNLNDGALRNNNDLNSMDNNNLNGGALRNNNNLNSMDNNNLNNGMTRPNNSLSTNLSNNMSDRATKIAQRVTSLPEINDASVIINGDTAIVGCDVKDSTDNKLTNDMKKKVEAAVKVADKNIKNVSVTSDPNIYTRIQTMTKDMNNNMNNGMNNMKDNSLTNFTKDIEDIMRQITNTK